MTTLDRVITKIRDFLPPPPWEGPPLPRGWGEKEYLVYKRDNKLKLASVYAEDYELMALEGKGWVLLGKYQVELGR